MTNEIEKAIEDAARRILVAMGRVEMEMRKTRELRAERLPVAVQPKPEDRTGRETEQPAEDKTEAGDLTQYQAETVTALECCVEHPDCKGCPLVDDDECSENLPKRALATIKQLQEQLWAKPEPRAEERFELTERERDLIRIIKCCVRDDCENCGHEEDITCVDHLVKRAFDLIERLLAEKGVDIDDL